MLVNEFEFISGDRVEISLNGSFRVGTVLSVFTEYCREAKKSVITRVRCSYWVDGLEYFVTPTVDRIRHFSGEKQP